MPITNFYNANGLGQYQPGNLTRSDSTQVEGFFPFSSPLYAQTTLATSVFPVNTTTPFSITLTATGEFYSGSVTVGATLDTSSVVSQINQLLPALYTAGFNPTTNLFVIDTAIPGTNGIFTINGSVANTTTPANAGFLRAGRFVVPVTNVNDVAAGLRIRGTAYRYPFVGDTASTLAAGVFVIKDAHTNMSRQALAFDIGQVLPGTPFAALTRGEIIVSPITAMSGTSTILVETNIVGDLAGRLTTTSTATTLAIPAGRMQIMSGTTAANQNARLRVL